MSNLFFNESAYGNEQDQIPTTEPHHIYDVSYSVHYVSTDQVYKEAIYHILMQNQFKNKIDAIYPKFDSEFDESIFGSNTLFKELNSSEYPNGLLIEIVVTFNSDKYDEEKLKSKSIIKGITVQHEEISDFITIPDSAPTFRIP